MTISTDTYKNTYTADGSDTTFDFSFKILDEDHLTVEVINSSGTLQLQSINIDYTVSGTGNTDGRTNYTSGTVTFSTAPLSGTTVIIKRSTPLSQVTDYVENDTFPAETHEEALDKLTLIAQDMQEQLDRCFKMDYTGEDTTDFTLPDPVANYYIRFNDDATGLEAVANTGSIGLDNVVEDPSPQLGGNLDVNGNTLTSASNGNITIDPHGTGIIELNAATVTVEDDITHAGDTNTKITFGTDTINFQTGGSSRLDISDLGVRLGGANLRVTTILDEDDLSSNSDTALATQQSIKAYTDNTAVIKASPILGGDLDLDGYSIITNDNNESITINPHGSGSITLTTDSGGNVNIASANDIDLQSDSILIGNKITHKGDTNTFIAVTTDAWDMQTGGSSRLDITDSGVRLGGANSRVTTVLDEDAMGSDSATALATQQSIKAYVDNKAATNAQMDTGTATNVYATPSNTLYHQSTAAAWANIQLDFPGPTVTVLDSMNVASVSSSGTTPNTTSIVLDVDAANTNYIAFAIDDKGSIWGVSNKATTGFDTTLITNVDRNLHVVVYGNLTT